MTIGGTGGNTGGGSGGSGGSSRVDQVQLFFRHGGWFRQPPQHIQQRRVLPLPWPHCVVLVAVVVGAGTGAGAAGAGQFDGGVAKHLLPEQDWQIMSMSRLIVVVAVVTCESSVQKKKEKTNKKSPVPTTIHRVIQAIFIFWVGKVHCTTQQVPY